jgi:hypothetical protein
MVNLDQALRDMHQASDERTEPNAASRIRTGRQVLIGRGCEAFGIERPAGIAARSAPHSHEYSSYRRS